MNDSVTQKKSIGSLWRNLVVENPMLIEIQRFRRKYLTFSGGNAMNGGVLTLIILCFIGILLMVIQGKGEVSPIALVIFQTGLLTVFAPGMLYGAIAGERERRSWDLLLVAPITKAQIVVGKFLGALTALATTAAAFAVPIALAGLMYRRTQWGDLILAEAISLSFAAAVCALTILFSARVKRPYMALGTTLGTLAVSVLIIPIFFTTISGGSSPYTADLVFFLHPFYALAKVAAVSDGTLRPEEYLATSLWGWPQILMYLGITAILVSWAANTLIFAENEVKFLPQKHSDA